MNIENANSHPYKVVLTKDTDEMYANSHPYQVEIVGGGGGTEGKVVDELPEEGETGYIYLVLKEESEEGNIYDEYMWVLKQDDTYGWEHIGATNEVSVAAIKTLTVADYNYPASNPTKVALWLLESGFYKPEKHLLVKEADNSETTCAGYECYLVIKPTDEQTGQIVSFEGSFTDIWSGIDSNGQNATRSNLVLPIDQTTGTATNHVMSQNATTSMVYADPSTKQRIKIGNSAVTNSQYNISIGEQANTMGSSAIAIGYGARSRMQGAVCIGAGSSIENNSSAEWSVALGASSNATRAGEVNIGAGSSGHGYNSTNYRVLGGVHDPVDAHDAATKGYVDTQVGNIETILQTLTTGTGA